MTPDECKAWRKRLKLTQEQAAKALGLTRQGWQKREDGTFAINREAEYAMRYLEEHPEILEQTNP